MESKALITEAAAASYEAAAADLVSALAAHAAKGLEAHADSLLLVGTPYLDNDGQVVTPDTFRFRTVRDDGTTVLIDLPVVLFAGHALTNTESAPPPPDPPPSSVPPTPAVAPAASAAVVNYGGGGCFPKLTRIKLADGTFRRIEELKAGDRLASYDLAGLNPNVESAWRAFHAANLTLTEAETTVKTLKVDTFSKYLILTLGDGSVLRVTYEHPILCQKDWLWQFLPAGDIQPGVLLASLSGPKPVVQKQEVTATIITYNIDVEPYDLYVADTIVVHNVLYKF